MALLGITATEGTELSQLVAGDGCVQKEITLKASCGDLSRGTVLEMVSVAGGQWQQLQAADGSAARAILLEDVEDASATQKAQAYFIGKYRADDLIWPSGITATQKRTAIVALQDRGIIIDETIIEAAATTTTTTTAAPTTTTAAPTTTTTT